MNKVKPKGGCATLTFVSAASLAATATPSNLTAGQSAVDVVITGTSASGSEFFDPGADTGGPGFANHIAAAVNGGGVTVNSVTFSNPTNITINVTVSASAIAGDRTVTVTNPDGRSSTSASAIVTILAGPNISAPPQNQTVAQGSNATFSVTASGTPPLSYQWRFNQVEIPTATTNSCTRTNAQCADAGNYDVVITNSLGSVTSSVASLTVVTAPGIAVQPTNQTVFAGQSASFMVTATNQCGGGLAYQWRLNGTDIAAATTNSYTRSGAQPADAGNYTVAVTTLAGSVTSAVATLTVMAPPSLLSPTVNGGNFSFSFATVTGFTYLAQYKNSLSDPVWQTFQSITGDGTTKTITVPLSAAVQRFYRVTVQ